MKNIINILLVLLSSSTFTACTKEAANSQASLNNYAELQASKAGTVTGKATDSRSNVLPGAKVTVEHTVWHATYVLATTDSKGKYNITIPSTPAGRWSAKAQLTRNGYGMNYLFDLDGDTASFTKDDAVVRNFKWKLSGKKTSSNSYYGAHVDLYPFGTGADMTKVKINFTPLADTLIDGSPAVSFVRTVEDVAGTFMVKDVPVGKYSIKAIYPGKTLYLENRHDNKGAKLTQPVVFGKYGILGETEYNIEFWVSE